MNKGDCFILDGGKNHPILVYMPTGARKMEQFRAIQIRDEDHARNAEVEILGNFFAMANFIYIHTYIHLFSSSLDQFTNNFGKFFEMLGSGSQGEVPEESDDDAAAEKENQRQDFILKNVLSNFLFIGKSSFSRLKMKISLKCLGDL